MIELPEAVTIARQMSAELAGKRIASAVRGNAPHKFAFYSRTPEEYAAILAGKTMGAAADHGSLILAQVEPGWVLALGCGGERILYHKGADTLPQKHQLLLNYDDGTHLSVTVQGWGAAKLLKQGELAGDSLLGPARVSPVSDAFTNEHLQGLFAEVPAEDARSIKFFCISKPGLWGVGNGTLQDILFRARIHPRRRAVDLTEAERHALYAATRYTLQQAVDFGGRDSERDLYNRPGRYERILHSDMVGRPCPTCSTPVAKIQFLGGASYFCPRCQV